MRQLQQYFGNQGGGPTDFSPSTNKSKLARLWAFPDIVGRDAPGKTGSAAKPALIYLIEPKLAQDYDYPSQVVVRLGVWNSTGTGFVGSGPFNLTKSPEFVTPPNIFSIGNMGQAFFPTPRRVFSGVQYYIGHYVESPATLTVSPPTYYYYQVSPDTARVAFDTTPATSSVNFSKDGDLLNQDLGHLIYYDVLPSQPLSLSATVSGSLDLDITLSWTAPEFNGAGDYSTIEVTGYRIQRSTNSGATWTTIAADTATTATSYTDTNLAPGITYTYRVAAINPVATSHGADYSGPYSATAFASIPDAFPGNALSLLTATVANPEPLPLVFSDFGPGIRFTQIDVQYGAEYLYTQVEATTQDSFAELQVAEAPQSKELYGVRTYSITNLLNSDDLGAFEVAKDFLTYYYQPELRVQSVTVDLSNLTLEQKLEVLDLEIDDYISVSFTPNGIGDPKISSGLVTAIAHRITLTSHEVELRLRNERTLFTLDSDSKGILNVNILGP
jgi:hypothetical protein